MPGAADAASGIVLSGFAITSNHCTQHLNGNSSMQTKILTALIFSGLWATQALAVAPSGYEIPYVGAQYAHEFADGTRDSDGGNGYQLTFGLPVSWWQDTALELGYSDTSRTRHIDGHKDYQRALMIDVVRDAGLFGWPDSAMSKYLPQFKPFVLGGLGVIQEDVRGSKHYHAGADVGGGLLFPLPWYGASVRTDARVQAQANHQSVNGRDYLVDYRLMVGVQIPLNPFYKEHAAAAKAPDCEVAVVDINGAPRTDCGDADSDRDGVPDSIDQCPATPEGLPVDAKGCPAGALPEGATAAPTEVPPQAAASCTANYVVGESYRLKGVHFSNATATLTEDSKGVLDEVVRSLNCAAEYNVEIAGYTDAKGGKSYNLKLSKRRAEAVRDYLASKGVAASRLTAKGYGKANPRASNKTRTGREQNRRVEIKLIVI
jgi:OOP family OmpA-OmpF porin